MGIKLDELPERYQQQAKQQLGSLTLPCSTIDIKLPVESVESNCERMFVCHVVPVGKPRMTRRDKWKKRPCVMRYREFADKLRACFAGVDLIDVHSLSWLAYFPMPKSWSKKKKEYMRGMGHYNKPDRDNCDKAILDSLFDQDSGISHGTLTKLWDDGNGPRIEITIS